MHGFLNVLGAAVLAAEYKWDANQTALMLEDEMRIRFHLLMNFSRGGIGKSIPPDCNIDDSS